AWASSSLGQDTFQASGSNSTGTVAKAGLANAGNVLSAAGDDWALFTALPTAATRFRDSSLRQGNSLVSEWDAGGTSWGREPRDVGPTRGHPPESGLAAVHPETSPIAVPGAQPSNPPVQANHTRLPLSIAVHYGPTDGQVQAADNASPPGGPLIAS